MADIPSGLFYYDSAISRGLERDVEEWFADEDTQDSLFSVSNTQGKSSTNSRMVMHYGWKYNYSTGGTQERAPEFPLVIEVLRDLIPKIWTKAPPSFSAESLDQCIVNLYKPGQGIGAHSDSDSYGDTVVCFTFGGGREMEFIRGSESYRLYTNPATMYVMTGESRYEWKHLMRPRLTDTVNGVRIPRTACFSVTFRGVKRIPSKKMEKKAKIAEIILELTEKEEKLAKIEADLAKTKKKLAKKK